VRAVAGAGDLVDRRAEVAWLGAGAGVVFHGEVAWCEVRCVAWRVAASPLSLR
jgi:hypothetical protein